MAQDGRRIGAAARPANRSHRRCRDPSGNLWVGLTVPYTYVYDPNGEKIRTVQFRGAGILSPTSLFFVSPSVLLVTPGGYEFTVQ